MKLPATGIAALSLNLLFVGLPPGNAQSSGAFADPANLRGERVPATTGRELSIDQGTRGLEQMLRRLTTRASLLLIVAHPDDEDGGMLTLYSRGLGARVADLSLTRGEGGQNAMTGDFEDALGLIRTQELLSADRYTGVDQFFGTEVDFGFSKTKEEAFRKWTHERVLYDAVRAVRLYRPQVIAAVFVGGVTDGHGQHQVSGEIAQEVFKAAADPSIFPELTQEGIPPWAPLKVYARVPSFAITEKGLFDYATNQYVQPLFTNYVTGESTTVPPTADVVLHEGAIDPLLSAPGEPARSYVQFARIGLGLQRTQIGPGVRLAAPGVFDVGYHRYGSRLVHQPTSEQSFFDGIDTTLASLQSLATSADPALKEQLHRWVEEMDSLPAAFQPAAPERMAPTLAQALIGTERLLRSIPETGNSPDLATLREEIASKRVQLNQALALALGLELQAGTSQAEITVGTPVKVLTKVVVHAAQELKVQNVVLLTQMGGASKAPEDKRLDRPLTPDHPDTRTLTLPADENIDASRPYFFRSSIEEPVYRLHQASLRNAPASPPSLTARATVLYRGVPIELHTVVLAGQQPVRFVPAQSLSFTTQAQVVPNLAHSVQVTTALTESTSEPARGSLELFTTAGWKTTPSAGPLQSGKTSWTLLPPQGPREEAMVHAVARAANGAHTTEAFRAVGYGDLIRTDFFTPANDRLVPVDLRLPVHRRIGYISGTGDAVAETLSSIGFEVTNLTAAELTAERLAPFDTVILGVRTYNAHPELHGAPTAALLEFVRRGGNVVVQYQTTEFTAADAPYPLALGAAEKVVDETTPVRLLEPSAEALHYPNPITSSDFSGWVEERGHGFLQSWDGHYTALTETHDPGAPAEHIAPQNPQRGGWITTPLGKGHWTYCAFALYRQLPEAVPGAFRLMVNLVSLADGQR